MDEIWRRTATKLGEELAREHFNSLPIDPLQIAKNLGIEVEALPPEKKTVSGTLVQAGNFFGIQYATYIESLGFQNFCIAHELGHYSIPGHPEKLLASGIHESHAGFTSSDRCEQEADHFAAGLLMPSFLFDPAMDKAQSGLTAIASLSSLCSTSLTATAIRYAQRTPDAVAVIISEGNIIKYCFMSDELKEIRGLSWIRKDTPLPRDTATYRFNQLQDNVLKGAATDGETNLSSWFDCDQPFDAYEEVKGLGQYMRTLTVISIDELPDEEDEDLIESWTPRFRN
ncbi:ImmA/IrrE family metallo-endopeptidase [Marinobacter sp. C2H3]|uniref:ImmA/IrrE family metallo-endopeptidase n=1 Tax=Marinobacter sp. C2H3 TaxID=3119003 RepID=UPI00300E8151